MKKQNILEIKYDRENRVTQDSFWTEFTRFIELHRVPPTKIAFDYRDVLRATHILGFSNEDGSKMLMEGKGKVAGIPVELTIT